MSPHPLFSGKEIKARSHFLDNTEVLKLSDEVESIYFAFSKFKLRLLPQFSCIYSYRIQYVQLSGATVCV